MLEDTVSELIKLASNATDEDWKKIDNKVPYVCEKSRVRNWAYQKGLYDTNPNIRDLAASILEKAKWPIDDETMITHNLAGAFMLEKHPYAKFRMACALYSHGDRNVEVLDALKNSPEDVKDIAQKYLEQM